MRIDRLALLLLLAYLGVLALVTLRPIGADVESSLRLNLKPFATIGPALRHGPGSFVFAILLGNLLAFVPLGLLLPAAVRRINWLLVIAAGVVLSTAIELAQLAISLQLGFGYRSADVDDVIVNVAGTVVGVAIYTIARLVAWLFGGLRSAG